MVDEKEDTKSIPIKLQNGSLVESFFYYLDATTLQIQPGETVSYYFEITDNDGVNGPKSARTARMTFNMPSRAERAAEMEERREEVKFTLSEAAGKAARRQDKARKRNQMPIQKQTTGVKERKQGRR